MKQITRRKFMEKAMITGAGVSVMPVMASSGDNNLKQVGNTPPVDTELPGIPGNIIIQPPLADGDALQHDFSTMRPLRIKAPVIVTVGQDEGDLRGKDNIVLQAAVDYVAGLGGGTVHILPGTYIMRNSLFPKAGVTIRGSGEKTILWKAPSVSSKLIREADWYEYCVQVENPEGFTPGGGLALSADKKNDQEVSLFTITAIKDNILFLDRRTEKNFWPVDEARATTRFSIIHALNVNDVKVEDIILDGNLSANERVNDNYAAAVFIQYCDNWSFRNVTARNYNGDGFSFQVCDDVRFENCHSLNNFDLGYHPGSGSQRPVFKNCTAKGNSQGFFWCWGVCYGIAENCIASDNRKYGVNFGHRDTDNILRNCLVENNQEIGILFRKEENEFRTGDRNIIENCTIRNNGTAGPGTGIDIQWKTNDITIRDCYFENTRNGPQKTAIKISADAQRITVENNKFSGDAVKIEDLRKKS
ncbi:MAG TPA: right-handed parallel beta-helix repeat-containing protein [Bacteroidales bacterium]|nr:hypothetical protein [Bacteroidales bacterium]HNR40975.1 right-handed parallel beta-helix repeat-containing protein [Bacteroidales bacterium]HPM18148.1 right-handed parallel beta-helix repeat-containing protein [Bacteroidales bacterium]HQG78399.1 right-handed parallel beta-helix repeat-containing protein [Bacteroidales bacterium]